MNLNDLLLNIHDVSFNSLVPLTKIQTNEDKQNFIKNGYNILVTEDEFKNKFNIDPACVWYTPSVAQSCLYFNKDTLAASFFPLELYLSPSNFSSELGHIEKFIETREKEVSQKNFKDSLSALPDTMKIEYFKLLTNKFGKDIPDLYHLFFSSYLDSDYGFNNIDDKTMSFVLDSKTVKERMDTEFKLKEFPDKLKIYRGGNSASTPYDKAYSWTLDINVANFFACRRGSKEGYIVEAEVDKNDIFEAFLTNRSEQEVLVDPNKINILSKTPIHGIDYLKNILPDIVPIYHDYLNQLENLTFIHNSSLHGCSHEARVLLLCLTIAHILELPPSSTRTLATAAIYHDTRRIHDETDEMHGKASKDYYSSSVKRPDPLVEFLCEYHCLPDEAGYKEIMNNRKLSKNRSHSKLLFDIFKDADALDRVRLGLKDLDYNQLRLPISKELTLVARLYLEQIKVNIHPKIVRPDINMQIEAAMNQQSLYKSSSRIKEKEIENF